ncbi:MAG: hypothetical protein AUJ32_00625 [Parcubacteria group bacterium CG1_02_40_82]|uniref:DUF5667 domain-containing protein n=4 Tax=Candidatus Portnoyibacteriota TaxID=1817913 RepID=A0A2M7YN72_9BACT|nr:MAG: hypothetical protein AUJ32_00625 [Parcubacteria group bacterium CG1_02_40_82]PIQ75625.1 MAG: hypothetical protein COV84_00215 [Candidatus Portnoybacteria bacterium CG11_big_fil_rev_8_21_14_0_20_40_15]PIS31123.1 MAG: hypothetical protein COT41_02450 [Candidatus Portnoybacteria bacterium CG08_land_8_20_14_0_20_40_83]PIY75325.1 MAG: hypothetical protein COY85_00590 [Candidatus Portnoybacteria bacterium CG_4_10_14_0_8_um_filter_40_50]PJA64429.1 MAG: hypothetical protein CO159_03115 [Candida
MEKITEQEIIDRLTQLKKVRPDDNWVIFCRQNLASEISKNYGKETMPAFNFSSAFASFMRYIRNPHPVLKPVVAFVLIFGFMFSGGLVVIAKANNSLPGDRLFSVKLALEEAKLLTATSAEGKAQVQTDMITVRIDELNRIINQGGSMEQKQPKIEEAVNNLQSHLLSAKDALPKLNNTEAKKVVEVAKRMDASAASAEQSLSEAKSALSPDMKNNLTDKIAEAADEADKTSTKALETMVQRQGEAGVSQTEIAVKVDEKIQKTEQMVKTFAQSINNSAIADKLPINATIVLDESDKAIEQARLLLENNDITGALQAIKSASEMVKSAQKLVDNASPAQTTQQANPVLPNNATSSPGLPTVTTSSPSSILDLEPKIITTSTLPITSVFGTGINNE